MRVVRKPSPSGGGCRRRMGEYKIIALPPAFTLIEALASLAIISIMLMISIPFMRNFMIHTQDEILQNQIMNAIELAKREAIAHHAPVALTYNNNQKILIFLDEYADGVPHDHVQIIAATQTASHHGPIHFRHFQNSRNYLLFSPTEFMKNDNATFWHCHENSVIWAIAISKNGKARITSPDEHKLPC